MQPNPNNRHNLDWLVLLAGVVTLGLVLLTGGCSRDPAPASPDTAVAVAAVSVQQAVGDAQEQVSDVIEDPIDDAQRNIAHTSASAVVAIQTVVQDVLPPVEPSQAPALPAAATRLIVRWEVSSPAYYTARLQNPVWPGGSSGVTWGIGYDGGFQTAGSIRNDWAAHAAVDQLATTAGIAGTQARALARSMRTIRTPLAMAQDVFTVSTLPRYHAAAGRALGPDFALLPEDAQGSLDSTGYNRGWSMLGPNRREMRYIRDVCVPARDIQCIAGQQRSMKRLWPGARSPGPGLRARRESEAVTTESAT